jgi:hypothetical protein
MHTTSVLKRGFWWGMAVKVTFGERWSITVWRRSMIQKLDALGQKSFFEKFFKNFIRSPKVLK